MIQFADKTMQQKLIYACNLLCDHVQQRLPPGFEIMLSMSRDEASICLMGPDGKEIECLPDSGISAMDDMCCVAIEEAKLKEPKQ